MRRHLSIITFALLLGLIVQAAAAEQHYLVEAELWIDGVQRGTPSLLILANTEASVGTGDDDAGWRLEVEVEPVDDRFAPSGTLWVHVAVHQRHGEYWEHLADSIVGVPEGEFATVSVVDGDAMATPETAHVYLRIRTTRAGTGGEPGRPR
jgi:hypothetical protein